MKQKGIFNKNILDKDQLRGLNKFLNMKLLKIDKEGNIYLTFKFLKWTKRKSGIKHTHIYAGFPVEWRQNRSLLQWIFHRLFYYCEIWSLRYCDEVKAISQYASWEYYHHMPKWFLKRYHGYTKNPCSR